MRRMPHYLVFRSIRHRCGRVNYRANVEKRLTVLESAIRRSNGTLFDFIRYCAPVSSEEQNRRVWPPRNIPFTTVSTVTSM